MPATLLLFRATVSQPLGLTSSTLVLLVVTVIYSLGSNPIVSILLSIESSLFLNYYLTPPFHSLRVASASDVVTLIIFIFSSISVSTLINLIVNKQTEIESLLTKLENSKVKSPKSQPNFYVLGPWRIDLAKQTVSPLANAGSDVHLTPIEWKLLEVLVKAEGGVVKQTDVLKAVWGEKYGKETNYLRLYLSQLRKKLEESPKRPVLLITEPGIGHRAMSTREVNHGE
jgi:DNA-binding winged helix-turn-helix (wHTH) protein